MRQACIAIVEAARARIYTYDDTDPNGGRTPAQPALHEEVDMVNPGRRGHDEDRYSTTKPGIKRDSPGGGSTDDHRDAHVDQLERSFAKAVVEEVDRITRMRALGRVIVVAGPHMLGELRRHDGVLHRSERSVEYVDSDLAGFTPPQIHDRLADLKLISPRRRLPLTPR